MKISKRILSVLLALCMVLTLFSSLPFTVSAETATSGTTGECTWTLDDTKLTISGNGKMANYPYDSLPWSYSITEVVIEDGVTSIGAYAFNNCSDLKSIKIPESVTSVGEYAFFKCQGLKKITLPNSVTSIAEYAFKMCQGLESITLPNSITSIEESVFEQCTGLKSITIPKSVTTIGTYAFYECSGLTSITIPENVTKIGFYPFANCSDLASITVAAENPIYHSSGNCIIDTKSKTLIQGCKNSVIPSDGSVTNIENGAFYGCTNLESITIPDSVTSISDAAFGYCTSLKSVTIPNSVTSIAYSAFEGAGLESVTIPNSVTRIDNYAFYRCASLKSISIPSSVTSIGYSAFNNCENLASITLPDSVTSIGNYAFDGTAYYKDSSNWENGVLYIGKHLISSNSDISSDYTIKDGTLTIATYAFYNSKLESITIPDSVRSIGHQAFYSSSKLESITIPDSVTSIGANALSGTAYYKNSANWENGVLYIGKHLIAGNPESSSDYTIKDGTLTVAGYAFSYSSNLESVTIPKSVIGIGISPFSSCYALTSITVQAENPIYHSNGNCIIDTKNKTLIQGCKSSVIPTDGSVTSIGESAFDDCKTLSAITIPSGITSIEDYAFYECESLESIKIPAGVTSIGVQAFDYCEKLKSAIIPISVTKIDSWAFDECSEDFEICGAAGSYAEKYANAERIKFTACQHTETYIGGKKAATCTKAGYTGDTKCKDCDYTVKKGKTVAALGHKYKTTITKATFSKNGKTVKTCKTCGKSTSTTIYKVSSVKLSATSYAYNGKAKKPTVTVKNSKGKTLKNGTDYTLSYSNSKNVGKASVKVTLKGNYSGTKTVTFKINPKSTSLKSVAGGKKQITAKWNKQATQTTGYQIQYSTSSAFKNAKTVTVTSNKTTSKTVKNLSGGKKYYVRVRTYKTVGKTKYYSAWSSAKYATAKKK